MRRSCGGPGRKSAASVIVEPRFPDPGREEKPQSHAADARPRPAQPAAWRISCPPLTLAPMLFFLTSQPLWISGAIIIGGGTLLAMLGPVLVRRYVALDRLTINNEIAGFKFATVGVLYAVLLAFVIIVVWEKFQRRGSQRGARSRRGGEPLSPVAGPGRFQWSRLA
jgi:hypothetical protein